MSDYILGESADETRRLVEQAAREPIQARAVWGGLRPGMRVVDAGCGPGETTRFLSQIAGPTGSVLGFDLSEARLEAARSHPPALGAAPIEYLAGSVYAPPVAPGSVDFVYCQYVFEYLAEPERALAQLVGLLRPGGRILLYDVDEAGMNSHPLPPLVEAGLPRLLAALATTGFDPRAGRKLFGWMVGAGLGEVDAALHPTAFAGRAPEHELEAWRQRFQALAPFGPAAFGSQADYAAFSEAFLAMLADAASLKYTVFVAVRGTRRA